MIQINDLSFSYGHMPVLEHITMKLEPGRIYGLLGENGVGKTTLLTLLCGLKKPLGGSIDVDGDQPFKRNPNFLADLQFLPDEVAAVNSPADRWAKVSGQFWPNYDNEKFLKIMKELETDSTKKMIQMSAGQLKKTYIAFALACNTRYLKPLLPAPKTKSFPKSYPRRTSASWFPTRVLQVLSWLNMPTRVLRSMWRTLEKYVCTTNILVVV